MKKLILIIVFIKPLSVFSQIDSLKNYNFIYNHVYKNIAAYHINASVNSKQTFDASGFLKRGIDAFFFDEFLPDIGSKLDMTIKKLDWKYPMPGYEVYQVKLNGFRYSNDSTGKTLSYKTYDGPLTFDSYYIFAINGHTIKFIAGNYFVNDISQDFHLDKKDPNSYLDYLKFRAFPMQVDAMTFVKKRKQKYVYKGHSREINKDVFISIDINKLTNLQVSTHLQPL